MDLWKGYLTVNDEVTWSNVENQCIILHLHTGFYYTLNELGRFLWESLDGKKTLEEVHRDLLDRYDVDDETAKQDVLEIVGDLMKEDLARYHAKGTATASVS